MATESKANDAMWIDAEALFSEVNHTNQPIQDVGSIDGLPQAAIDFLTAERKQLTAEDEAAWNLVCEIQEREAYLRKIQMFQPQSATELMQTDKEIKSVKDEIAVMQANLGAPALTKASQPDFALLATRTQLIAAFGSFTGMNAEWFNNLKDTPSLHAARKVVGQGGRGHVAEPLFCPFEVLQWLIDPARRKGGPLGQEKGWQLFESSFPRAYAVRSVGDPRTD